MESSQQKKGGMIPVSPCRTPSKAVRELRSADSNANSNNKMDKEKGVNVQVILRCRPLSQDEVKSNTPVVINCNENRREVTAVQNIANKQIDRSFAFDKVFGPSSKQEELFNQSIVPIVNEVLEGYNCTIFAYGQTGTGKTYTMEGGGKKSKDGELPSDAGVIPRSVKQIFDILEAQCAEYSMKVTFLELYNEEITDLLAPDDLKFCDEKSKKPIALMEDGKGGVFVRGLEDEVVYTADEIYKILDKGSAKRRTAETLLNKQSSRSHSIFSITIHIKECTPEGEEVIKCGKLNLVDLAGSENISRSGARDGRAREAGEINKSLLTLGRVINALVEHSGHVPYRDSKLTRLLRDSLGGKTRTCIIATISPSIHCLEETLSTLDYAHRAKNIKNKPEINQKTMKSAMIKDLCAEIDRLKQEVLAAREKNGIYIPRDRFLLDEAEKKAMTEKIERLELDIDSKEKQYSGIQELYNSQQQLSAELSENLEITKKKLKDTQVSLLDLEERYRQANLTIKENEYLILNLQKSEKVLADRAHELRKELENAAADISGLFSKLERKDKIEDNNRKTVQKFQSELTEHLDILHRTVSASMAQQENQLKEMENDMHLFASTKAETVEELKSNVERIKDMYASGINTLSDLTGEIQNNSEDTFGRLNAQVSSHSSALGDCIKRIVLDADKLLNELQDALSVQESKLSTFAQNQRQRQLRTMEATRSVSRVNLDFFSTLDSHASSLSQIIKESQTVDDQRLHELEKKFEECAANEEKQLLEKVAEMLASSISRKKELVVTAVDSLRANAADRANKLENEMSTARKFTNTMKEKWEVYMGETEENYISDNTAVESGNDCLVEGLKSCTEKVKMGMQQWSDAESSLANLGLGHVTSVDSIVRRGMEADEQMRSKLSSQSAATLNNVDVASKNLVSSIDESLKLDQDACANIDAMLVPCRETIKELKCGHHHKMVEIKENSGRCLQEEYAVDKPTCSTPRQRSIVLPSVTSIEELRTPAFEELLKSFREIKSPNKLENGEVKQCSESPLQNLREPLATIN